MVCAACRNPRARSVSFSKSIQCNPSSRGVDMVLPPSNTRTSLRGFRRSLRKLVAEEVARIPARGFRCVGEVPRDQIVDPRELRTGLPVEGLAHVIADVVVMRLFECLCGGFPAIGRAEIERNGGNAFLDEAVVIGPDKGLLLRGRVGSQRHADRLGGPGDGLPDGRMLGA